MSSSIKVDIQRMCQELAILKDAIERFRPFVEQKFVDEILYAEGMRSDLTSKLEDVLENMKDKSATRVLENLKTYYQMSVHMVNMLNKTDQEVAQRMGGQ